LGRTLGWGGVVAGTAAVIVTAVTGVHVLTASALPFLICLLWILAVSVRLGVQRASRVPAETAPDAAPAAV
jgi:type IV secretory pathway VirB2 component (pilin)